VVASKCGEAEQLGGAVACVRVAAAADDVRDGGKSGDGPVDSKIESLDGPREADKGGRRNAEAACLVLVLELGRGWSRGGEFGGREAARGWLRVESVRVAAGTSRPGGAGMRRVGEKEEVVKERRRGRRERVRERVELEGLRSRSRSRRTLGR